MKDRDAAQDALQEAFVDAFTRLDSFRGEASFGSWLKRIVIHRCLAELKKQQRLDFIQTTDQLPQPSEEPDQTHPDDDWDYEIKRIKAAIAELPDGARTVLTLYLLEGYSHQEIADILSITNATSKAQYSKAKKRLRQLLRTSAIS